MASIHSDQENEAVMKLAKTTVYIAAESDGKGNWKWSDCTKWWQPTADKTDKLEGTTETRVVITTDNKWNDWKTGGEKHGVVCAKGRFIRVCARAHVHVHCIFTCVSAYYCVKRCA